MTIEPRNLLEAAALCDDVDRAARMIQNALGITTGDLAGLHLEDPVQTWKRRPVYARLERLAQWLKAECFECMDLAPASTPPATIGDRYASRD